MILPAIIAASTMAAPLGADECGNGQDRDCTNWQQCAHFTEARLCIDDDFNDAASGKCQVSCKNERGERDPSLCTAGEVCVDGFSDLGKPDTSNIKLSKSKLSLKERELLRLEKRQQEEERWQEITKSCYGLQ